MDDIEVIETEWGSELHRRLIAEEHAQRIAWRNSPEALEEMKRLREAGPLEWGRRSIRAAGRKRRHGSQANRNLAKRFVSPSIAGSAM